MLQSLLASGTEDFDIAVTEPKRASTVVRPETLAMLSTAGG